MLLVLLVLPRSAFLETQRFRLPAPPPAGAGASQPARTMDGYADMAALNKSSSKIATFAVRIVGAKIGEYTFTSKRDTKPVVQRPPVVRPFAARILCAVCHRGCRSSGRQRLRRPRRGIQRAPHSVSVASPGTVGAPRLSPDAVPRVDESRLGGYIADDLLTKHSCRSGRWVKKYTVVSNYHYAQIARARSAQINKYSVGNKVDRFMTTGPGDESIGDCFEVAVLIMVSEPSPTGLHELEKP